MRESFYISLCLVYMGWLLNKSVHRLFVAPNKGRRAAKAHHAVVDAKVTPLRNDNREYSDLLV